MSVYEKRATLFLDLLGFRNLVAGRRERDILGALTVSPKNELLFKAQIPPDLDFQVTAFSDCIVCSARILARNNFLPAAYLATYAGVLALQMLARGILVRGAMTVGNLHHRQQMVFGPALIEAYELESQLALYPRIVALPKVYGPINLSLVVKNGANWFLANEPFREDFDGVVHLDILGPYFMDVRPAALRLKNHHRDIKKLGTVTTRFVNKLCQRTSKNPKIYTKYEWMKSYLDDCCVRFGWKRNRMWRNRFLRSAKPAQSAIS